jgi:microcystin-dependent protein
MTQLGTIIAYAGPAAPPAEPDGEQWLLCDGTPISRQTYAGLYALIESTYGQGDDVSTFNLPDLRGQFMRGVDAGTTGPSHVDPDAASRTAMAPGGATGNAVGSVQAGAVGSHAHAMTGTTEVHVWKPDDCTVSWPPNDDDDSGWTDPTGDSETRPINVALTFLIRAL